MTLIKGSNISAPIVPYDNEDQYPTHISEYGKGGWHEVETIQDRDAITKDRLHPYMSCMVKENKTLYILDENYEWYEFLGTTNDALNKEIEDRRQADTDLNTRLTAALAKETQERVNADKAADQKFTEALSKEQTDRTQADNDLDRKFTDALANEKKERTESDDTLTENLNQEIADRTKAVEDEATTREENDTALDNKFTAALNQEAATREANDNTLQNNLDTETAERKQAISNEEKARTDADTALGEKLDKEISDRETAVSDLTTATDEHFSQLEQQLADETKNREEADSSLNSELTDKLDQEIADRTAGDTTLTENLNTEIENRTNADTTLQNNLDDEASTRETEDTKLQNALDAEIEARTKGDSKLQSSVDTINSKIPEQASAANQLADKNFVNSTMQTNTANFRGNWATYADIPTDAEQYPVDYYGNRTPTINDYLVVQDDENKNDQTWRYKYSGNWAENGKDGWHPEYEINETPFTAKQLAAINSGATEDLVKQITINQTDIASLEDSKQDVITGAASTVVTKDLTPETVVISNNLGKIASSTVTIDELDFLKGVTSNIQEQLDDKQGTGNYATKDELSKEVADRTDAIQSEAQARSDADTELTAKVTANTTAIATKQDKLTAGKFINIDADNNITTTYTAGDGIAISETGAISNTRVSAEWGNITGNIADQTDLQEAITSAGSATDDVTIHKTAEKKLEVIGVIEKNKSSVKIDWVGTYAEWEAGRSAGTIPDEWICYITDDVIDPTEVYSKTAIDNMISQINEKFTGLETQVATMSTQLTASINSLSNKVKVVSELPETTDPAQVYSTN